MSIPARLRSARRNSSAVCRPAFTLIELLVVVAIIALLISILLPSLQAAREQARRVTCGTTLSGFGRSMGIYATESSDWYPGPNTSGVAVRAKLTAASSNPSALQQPSLPMQAFDWMSPLLRNNYDLPANRAQRWKFFWTKYGCPSISNLTCTPYRINALPDADLFKEIATFPACSYLMPASFAYWGQRQSGQRLATDEMNPAYPVSAWVGNSDWEVRTDDFVSRLDKVGTPAQKVFVADGTRYLDESLELDFDANPFTNQFGAFTDSSAWWSGSRAWGVQANSPSWGGTSMAAGSLSNGRNLPLSYRHGSRSVGTTAKNNRGEINALFFDGHVATLGDRASREVSLWYPKGSVVQSPTQGLSNAKAGDIVP